MKNIDILWENTEKRFREHFDNKKTVWGGYAISFVSIALAILTVGVTVWRHREFTGETLGLTVVLSLLGITSFVFCYFRKTAPIRVKFYTVSLVMALVPTYMLTFHPEATSRRYPYPEFNRAVEFVGIVFFGGGGLCVLYKDIMWHLKHKSKRNIPIHPENHIKTRKTCALLDCLKVAAQVWRTPKRKNSVTCWFHYALRS